MLILLGGCEKDSDFIKDLNRKKSVNITEKPEANFKVSNVDNLYTRTTVEFSDSSKSTPTSWEWNFGDRATSTEQNPSHTYYASGSFKVTLKVSNSFGSTTIQKWINITHNLTNIYREDFSNSEGYKEENDYFINDVNNDYHMWEWRDYNGYIVCNYSNYNEADDWFFSQDRYIYLRGGCSYNFSFDTKIRSETTQLEVKLGVNHYPSNMNKTIMDVTDISNTEWVTKSFNIRINTSGYYYMGFHALGNGYSLYINNINVTRI